MHNEALLFFGFEGVLISSPYAYFVAYGMQLIAKEVVGKE